MSIIDEAYPDDDRDDYDDDPECSMCGGEGEQECNDFIQCMSRHTSFRTPGGYVVYFCACIACDGTGLAENQSIW